MIFFAQRSINNLSNLGVYLNYEHTMLCIRMYNYKAMCVMSQQTARIAPVSLFTPDLQVTPVYILTLRRIHSLVASR